MSSTTNIRSWLEIHGLGDLAPAFEHNRITLHMLPTLTADDMREMGITALGHRKRILAAIATLGVPGVLPPVGAGASANPAPAIPAESIIMAAIPAESIVMPVVVDDGKREASWLRSREANAVASDSATPLSQAHSATKTPQRTAKAQGSAKPATKPASSAPSASRQSANRPSPAPAKAVSPPLQGSATALQDAVAPNVAPSTSQKRKGFSGGFFTVSIALHLVLGLGAGYWVVQEIAAKRKLQFKEGPPTASPSKRALEHKVSLQKRRNAGGAPAQAKRISVQGLASSITLPEMPAMPNASTQFVAGRMAGMGGAGFGTGLGFGNGSGMGVGGMGKGGLGLTMFGARGGAGLTGTFYDLKRDEGGKPSGMKRDRNFYTKVLKDFTNGTTWKMPSSVKCYTGKSKLVAKAFLFPAIPDEEAGKAFNEPETGPGMWIAHYTGMVKVPVSGKYRFVGWGDNLMAVRFGSKIVLDASDIGYLKEDDNRQGAGKGVSFPKKGGTPLIAGSWMNLSAGAMMKMDVLLGDEGGIYCAGLLLEKEGSGGGAGKHNIPDLPIFLAAPLSTEEKRLYDNYVPAKSLSGPVFNATAGGSSPLDMLKR